jgi:hypothetical protein
VLRDDSEIVEDDLNNELVIDDAVLETAEVSEGVLELIKILVEDENGGFKDAVMVDLI